MSEHVDFDQVTIISITYKSRKLVDSMAANLHRFPRLVIVDNGSDDGTPQALREKLPNALIVERTTNGGFGRANNEAMELTRTPFALMLNPDCHIASEDLETLLRTMQEHPAAGIVAPQGWHAPDKPQMSFRQAFYESAIKAPYQIPDATYRTQWLHGSCLLVRTEAFRSIGGFDEEFFLYYEDDDLCLRMQEAGFECLLEPKANALHTGGASTTPTVRVVFFKFFHYARSRHIAIRKYLGPAAGWRFLTKTMLAAIPAVPLYAVLLQRKHVLKWSAWGAAAFASAWRELLRLSSRRT